VRGVGVVLEVYENAFEPGEAVHVHARYEIAPRDVAQPKNNQ
jgi:hypothetical protein